jgi:hypothetical protein
VINEKLASRFSSSVAMLLGPLPPPGPRIAQKLRSERLAPGHSASPRETRERGEKLLLAIVVVVVVLVAGRWITVVTVFPLVFVAVTSTSVSDSQSSIADDPSLNVALFRCPIASRVTMASIVGGPGETISAWAI